MGKGTVQISGRYPAETVTFTPRPGSHLTGREACALSSLIPNIESLARARVYGPGCTIFRQGATVTQVSWVQSGWVELSHLEPTGKTVKRLAGPGSILGVEGMVTSTPHTMTARAATECELLYLDQRTFQVLLDSCPALARELLKSLSWKLQAWTDDFYQAAVKAPIIERLMRVLEITARECGRETEHGTRICIPLSVQDVADRIGCSRQWATKILKELEATGRLRRNGRWITLTRTTPARRIRLLVS